MIRFIAILLAVVFYSLPSAVAAYDDTSLFTTNGDKGAIHFRAPQGHLRKMAAWDPLTQAPPVPLVTIISAALSAYAAETKSKPEDWKFVSVFLIECSMASGRWYYTVQLFATNRNSDNKNLKTVAVLHDGTTILGSGR